MIFQDRALLKGNENQSKGIYGKRRESKGIYNLFPFLKPGKNNMRKKIKRKIEH